ncbi:hypothetical protein BHE74_00024201 [Ensete ventricosum]|nr:hypothetical protein BHE74_00024201 [Ensete ventricosum]
MHACTHACVGDGWTDVPVLFVVFGPELAGVVVGRSYDGEALGPEDIGVEGGGVGESVAAEATGAASGLELLGGGEGEEAARLCLDAVQQMERDAVPGDLERAPLLTCPADETDGVGALEVDDGDDVVSVRKVVQGRPCINVRDMR